MGLIRRSAALLDEGNIPEAERTIAAGLVDRESDGSLHAQLGLVYSKSSPARLTDARMHFQRAIDLGFSDPNLFRAWAAMEMKAGEFRSAAKVGREGIAEFVDDHELRLRLGESLWRMAHDQATVSDGSDLRNALEVLRPLVTDKPEVPLEPATRESAFALAAYVLTDTIRQSDSRSKRLQAYGRDPATLIGDARARRSPSRDRDMDRIRLRQILNRWKREFPSERQRAVAGRVRGLLRGS